MWVRKKTKRTEPKKPMAEKKETTVPPEAPRSESPSEGLSSAKRKKFDQLVKEKVSCSLPRADAEEVARRQINEDEAAAK